jgi:hypothetical protein
MKTLSLICAIAGGVICVAMTPARHGPSVMALVGVSAFIVYAAAPWFVRILTAQAPILGATLVVSAVLVGWLACFVLPSGPWVRWGNHRGEAVGYGFHVEAPWVSRERPRGRGER